MSWDHKGRKRGQAGAGGGRYGGEHRSKGLQAQAGLGGGARNAILLPQRAG